MTPTTITIVSSFTLVAGIDGPEAAVTWLPSGVNPLTSFVTYAKRTDVFTFPDRPGVDDFMALQINGGLSNHPPSFKIYDVFVTLPGDAAEHRPFAWRIRGFPNDGNPNHDGVFNPDSLLDSDPLTFVELHPVPQCEPGAGIVDYLFNLPVAIPDVVTLYAWTPNTDPTLPPFNLPPQFSSDRRLSPLNYIGGAIDGANGTFVLTTTKIVQDIMLFRNGVFQSEGVDYTLSWNVITFGASKPVPGDILTAAVFTE